MWCWKYLNVKYDIHLDLDLTDQKDILTQLHLMADYIFVVVGGKILIGCVNKALSRRFIILHHRIHHTVASGHQTVFLAANHSSFFSYRTFWTHSSPPSLSPSPSQHTTNDAAALRGRSPCHRARRRLPAQACSTPSSLPRLYGTCTAVS